jgi:hypothetical protein
MSLTRVLSGEKKYFLPAEMSAHSPVQVLVDIWATGSVVFSMTRTKLVARRLEQLRAVQQVVTLVVSLVKELVDLLGVWVVLALE